MREKTPADQLLYSLDTEKTSRRNSSIRRKKKQLAKQGQQQGDTSCLTLITRDGGAFSNNSPSHLATFVGTQGSPKVAEMKRDLLQLLHAQLFAGLDQKYPYAH